VTSRGPVVRALAGLGLVCAAFVALASSIVLHGGVLVVVLLAVAGAATLGYFTRDGGRAAALDAAWKAAGATAAVIVLGTGLVVLAGGAAAAVVIGLAAVIGGVRWALTTWLPRRARARISHAAPGAGPVPAPAPAPAWQPPVSLLATSDLGGEWLRTTWALARQLRPGERQDIIRRRQETLDELERRDPDGFARWLAAGPAAGSDPAAFVRGDRTTDRDAA
jgi:hypothetical protein